MPQDASPLVVVATLGTLALTGCQAAPPPPSPSVAQDDAGLPAVPSCADDAVAMLDGGLEVSYRGSDPNDADRCLVQWFGRPHDLYFGFWSGEKSAPMTDEARTALRAALTGPVGTEASFELQNAEMWKSVTVTHIGNGTTLVAGRPRPALELKAVRHDAQGRPDVRAETRFWIDRA